MKRIMILVLLISGYSISRVQGQATSSFNFSATSKPVTGWINVAGNPAAAVVTAYDAATGIHLSSVGTTFYWNGISGVSANDGGGMTGGTFFPAGVMQNFWFQDNFYSSAYNAAYPQLILSGLNIDSVYTISMTGSISTGSYDANPSRYTLAGAIVYGFIDVNANSNTSGGAVFHNIAPDDSGRIKVYVNPTVDGQGAILSGIKIVRGSTPTPVPIVGITSPVNNDVLLEDNNITINATATETSGTIKRVEFYANGTKIGQDSTSPYSMVWVNPDADKYTLTARAIDGLGNINTASINISVESLSSFWSMTGNIGMNPDSNFVGNVDSVRLAFRTKNLERMSISPIGNVGIGTIAPTAQLHTTGTVRLAGLTSDSTKNRVLVSDTSGNLFYRNVSSLSNRWLYSNGTLYDSTDNIAIGTNNPQGYKLAVNGTAIFTKVKVKTAGTWPDYVFKKGYNLPGLEELERYVNEHKHLPGIVSEADVQRDGIDIGEHQAALLKKMEEMTLYLIEENKKLKEQNKQLEEQNIRLEKQQQQIDELKKLIGREK